MGLDSRATWEIRKTRYLAIFKIEFNCHLPDVPGIGLVLGVCHNCQALLTTLQCTSRQCTSSMVSRKVVQYLLLL